MVVGFYLIERRGALAPTPSMQNMLYLPLDSRPCNLRFPVQLLACAGVTCTEPPVSMLDCFTRPSDLEAVRDFLAQQAPKVDTLVLSVDQLVYGSLLASREPDIGEAEALSRLAWIRSLKAAHPRLEIIAFSVVMRTSISTLRAEDLAAYHAVTEYSQASHRAKLSGSAQDEAEVVRIRAQIPADVLAKYTAVRGRNHAVNRACIPLVAEGVFDRLLLLQEDSQPLGFHKLEQAVLLEDIDARGLSGRIAVHNGTDEGGCLAAAMAARRPLRLHVRELGGGDCAFVAKYEDRPFVQNIESQCRVAGIELVDLAHADKVLCVLGPGGAPQADVYDLVESPEAAARLRALAAELAGLLDACDKPVALLDVYVANGGSVTFMHALAQRTDPLRLCGYAAWNTASNALGTVLAQMALGSADTCNDLFTVERLLDDLLYESVVRARLRDALEALGEDVLHLGDQARAEAVLRELMAEAVAESPVFAGTLVDARYSLPWPRIFEAQVEVHGVTRSKKEG